MELLNEPKNPIASPQSVGLMNIQTIVGMDAKQSLDAKLSLLKSFVQVKQALEQPSKSKDGYGYKYADLNAVLTAIQKAIGGLDLAYIQQPVNEIAKTGVENYIFNSKGAVIDFGSYLLDITKPQAQQYGSALTYCRRYSISSIFGIASEEDTDAKELPQYMSPTEIEKLTLSYKGKQVALSKLFSLGLAGDLAAKGKLLDRDNNNVTKLAVNSMTDMWDFASEISAMKSEANDKVKAKKDKEKKEKQAAVNKVQQSQKDPFADKKVETAVPKEGKLF
ncbi:hypothetical protein GTO82_07260 [Lactobacillus johnsonii]|uniref:Uncharacterized protein n=1 Tax=Lactobacillus johnsonii TaxID=33959 RepID=A0A9X7TX96_LACJH|nr:ERF family protein [Lactobacillus johnsonii]QLL68647.1 hypothetical protein GTO82_07260 [Lactobacillus johnsonii]